MEQICEQINERVRQNHMTADGNMEYIRGITFAPFAQRGVLAQERTRESLRMMKERTGADTVLLAPGGLQKTAQSVEIRYDTKDTMSDTELTDFIRYAKSLGLKVFLKPTVNCINGTWRAHINFFDEDVPCEPKWSEWFASYTKFQLHYAEIAEETGCQMFIAGCEMVMAERREKEWRELISKIRTVYRGPISYNTDKYQEHNVKWWDCVDVISSSGYYPADDWENQLDRIENVVQKYQKPFFFAELGCMSTTGSSRRPNEWEQTGEVNLTEQEEWYKKAFHAMEKRAWVTGTVLWSWNAEPGSEEEAKKNRYYEIYGKPAEEVVKRFFEKRGDK